MLTGQLLRERAGETEYKAGETLFKRESLREARQSQNELQYYIAGTPRHTVTLTAQGAVTCDCGLAYCRHCVATVLAAASSGALREMQRRHAFAAGPELLSAAESMLPEGSAVQLQPSLFIEQDHVRIGLRIGEDRLYVVRHIPQFLQAVENKEPMPFGKGFDYQPEWMRFDQNESALLEILAEYTEAMRSAQTVPSGQDARVLQLTPRVTRRVLEALSGMTFRIAIDGETTEQTGIMQQEVPLTYELSGSTRMLVITADMPENILPLTQDCAYLYMNKKITLVPVWQRAVVKTLLQYESEGRAIFAYPEKEVGHVLSELLPSLERTGVLSVSPALERMMIHLPLKAKVYLDKEGNDITARTVFAYGEHEIDPFAKDEEQQKLLLLRDTAGERLILDELAGAGFHVREGHVYLTGQDRVYDFVTQGVARLTKLCEVFCSNDFKRISPRKPVFTGSMRVDGGQLKMEMLDDGTPIEELLPLMEALRNRRKYFRYKDGTFLNLENADEWHSLAEAVLEAAEATGSERDLGACRASYFRALLHESSLPVTQDESMQKTADMLLDETPVSPIDCLRPYQERGFVWLHALHFLRMGGILADDMGLGKTVQMISALLYEKLNAKEKMPSVIVAPTSLTFNWQAEIKRFAPKLNVLLLSGGQAARAEQIESLKGSNAPDVVITSYPLIRRDITLLQDIPFRYAVLDEAQQVKNAQSVGAHAVKLLQAEARIALTGTPMENHAGELWSLFDFILPGYLPSFHDFMRRYGDGQNADDLRRRIRPFLMRRLKSEVLQELPEKMETTLMADMPPEQRKVYAASLAQKRERVDEILRSRGMQKGRVEVLSAITELRQICCHPALCIQDYSGLSGKLEMLMDILPGALQTGRRILIFSQFTSMLKIIRRRLSTEGIETLYLDGETPAKDRLALADRFNAGGHEDVFLISLKAGGTGLNLTGADMVIHYDPWWNPTAEMQAIDRAHRIGQTHSVQVLRLVMHQSIEEQVVSMNKRKRQLFDKLITAGEAMPTKLSDADILSLFDGDGN